MPVTHSNSALNALPTTPGVSAAPPNRSVALNRYPKEDVTAPLPNLPPPATEARPPATVVTTKPSSKRKPLVSGVANEPTPPERAPGPQLLPDATAEATPHSGMPRNIKDVSL